MPLLNDAKACYVGTQPITKIYAGTDLVWPKGPPPPFRDVQLYIGNTLADSGTPSATGFYLSWKAGVRPADCTAARLYEYRYTQIEDAYPDNQWKPYLKFGYQNCLCWMPRVAEFENKMFTFMDTTYVSMKPTVSVQLRYTNGTDVTVSNEIVFPIGPSDIGNYESLPELAQNYICPESC
jgi:hypothetical protein